jgi:capsular exopolysaccharide synthesis family protein
VLVRNTYIFDISATTTDPEKSKLIANTLADLYIADQVETKFQATEQAVTWLSEKVTELEIEIRKQENDIKVLRSNTELMGEESLQALNRQLIDVRDRLNETRADLALSETRLGKIDEFRQSDNLEALVNLLGDPTLRRIYSQLGTADSSSNKLFDDRLSLLAAREQTAVARLEQQIVALQDAVERQQRSIEVQSADFVQLQELERQIEATKILYETFLTRLKETTVQRGLQQADSRVLSEALLGRYVEPKKPLILMLSAILGVMVGSGIVLLKQFVHSGFRTAEELEQYVDLPILGQIPKMDFSKRDQLIDYLNTKSTSAASEAVRNLRTSVLLSNIDTPPKVIMSTSSVPGEGKTTQAISLAHNLAGMDKKVLLIEGDIRRRTFNEYLDGSGKRGGILSAMAGNAQLEDLIIRDSRMNVDILMGEKSSVNAADIFASEKFKHFIDDVRSRYDIVIIDTPPVLVVPDARLIGQFVDAIIFTVAWDRTTKAQIAESIRQFATANLSLTGLVLSQIDPKGMRRYGYGGRYGAYAAYGEGYYDT